MELKIQWMRPQPLTNGSRTGLIYTTTLDKLPEKCGIYIFGRHWGKSKFGALYVGKAHNVRSRVKGQLNNLRLMRHVQSATSGKRLLMAGIFATKSDRRKEKCLPLLERAFIRHFLSEGHDPVNKQGTRIRRHKVESNGTFAKSFFPSLIYLETDKGPRRREAHRGQRRVRAAR